MKVSDFRYGTLTTIYFKKCREKVSQNVAFLARMQRHAVSRMARDLFLKSFALIFLKHLPAYPALLDVGSISLKIEESP